MKYAVTSSKPLQWNVKAPGGREWTGAPSQPAALNLARSLAAIDRMLTGLHRPALAVVPDPAPRRASGYGCYRIPCKASR